MKIFHGLNRQLADCHLDCVGDDTDAKSVKIHWGNLDIGKINSRSSRLDLQAHLETTGRSIKENSKLQYSFDLKNFDREGFSFFSNRWSYHNINLKDFFGEGYSIPVDLFNSHISHNCPLVSLHCFQANVCHLQENHEAGRMKFKKKK